MNSVAKKRFIAGAKCPSCAKQDVLFVLAGALNEAVECALCGYREIEPGKNQSRASAERASEIQPVKFVDPN